METAPGERRRYLTLDGMRGVAAAFVLVRHANHAFDPIQFTNGFLAVDLFFILSGFVIAQSYDRKLTSGELSVGRFMLVRYIRLWPLYVLGAVLGLAIVYSQMKAGKTDYGPATFAGLVPFALLMAPSMITASFYPASAVAWSLFYELVANAAYAAFRRILSTPVLAGLVLVSGVLIVAAAFSPATLDRGGSWPMIWIGLARVTFSFGVGLLLHRFQSRLRLPRLPAWSILLLVGVCLGAPVGDLAPASQVAIVLLAMPLLVALGLRTEPGARMAGTYAFLGSTSYALYVLHKPVMAYLAKAGDVVGLDFPALAPWSGLAMLPALFAISWLADVAYDTPFRKWLSTVLLNRRPAPAVVAETAP